MANITIDQANLLEEINGSEKIPVGNGTGDPVTVSIQLIIDKVPQPDLTDYALKTLIPDTSNFATKDEIPTDVVTTNLLPTKLSDLEDDSDFISDAPAGTLYARSKGIWVPIEASPYNIISFDDNDGSRELNTLGDTSWIKGKRCLVKPTETGVVVCYLDENNSELFHDGVTPAVLDGSMGQWMTEIPEYWFSVLEPKTNIHLLFISKEEQEGWKHSRKVLLGVTEGYVQDEKLWSKCDGTIQSTGNKTSINFHNYATAVGTGFDIIDYESHCKIAHLFYAKYANRDPQSMTLFGSGQSSYTRIIGTTASLGNNDGKTSTQISFLGIEDFYGGKCEWIGGIHSNGSTYYIYDGFEPNKVPTVDYRTVNIGGSYRYGYISKMFWGEYGDLIPTEVSASSSTHYCDYGYVAGSGWRVVYRSCNSGDSAGGVAYFGAYGSSGYADSDLGSRLLYRGEISIIDDPNEFILI